MIPKILHHARFGKQPVSELNLRCLHSWQHLLPDWRFMFWDEHNMPNVAFCHAALKVQPANASIYTRLHALHEFGGVYLDNDAELVRVPELHFPAFLGFQRDDVDVECVNDGAMGSEPGHPFLKQRMNDIANLPPEVMPSSLGPELLTKELRKLGMNGTNVEQDVGTIHVYPKEVLYPFRWDDKPDRKFLTARTISIHWWEGSWLSNKFPQATGHFE